jgi:hypothetical protein
MVATVERLVHSELLPLMEALSERGLEGAAMVDLQGRAAPLHVRQYP